MNTTAPATLPASSLLDLKSRRVPPFDTWVNIAAIDGTRFDPPVLLEAVFPTPDTEFDEWVSLDVWTKNHGAHRMTGIVVHPAAIITVEFPPTATPA